MRTLTSIDICQRLTEKIGSLVTPAFEFAPNEFKALYRNKVQSFPGGFRRIDLVPKALMIRKITKDSGADPEVAVAILRNWFRAKPALHESAAAFLQTLGYKVSDPDFEHDSITHQSLAPAHIQAEDDAYYFSPGNDVTNFDKLELTLMAALLGWFPDKVGDEEVPAE